MISIIQNRNSAKLTLLGLALFFVITGCTPPTETAVQAETPPSIALKPGKVDAALNGTWETADKKSVMDLQADGTLVLTVELPAQGGGGAEVKNGKWSVAGTDLQLDVPGQPMVYQYTLEKDGRLMLKHPRVKTPFTYTKKEKPKP